MDADMETLAAADDADLLASDGGEAERLEAEAQADLLRDRLLLAVIKIATSEGKKAGMEVSDPVVACIADLAYKSVAHRNEHLMGLLRTFSQQLKGKEPASEKKRKKSSKKDDNVMQI
uniref:Uncharacterized protein n=1 Tax=Leersia perrieri TaxID=77586 RepID=A0A0D9W4E3_9ORYZ